MKNFKDKMKGFIIRYGAVVASCAFAFVAISANSSCCMPFYEPEQPQGLESFKKFNK